VEKSTRLTTFIFAGNVETREISKLSEKKETKMDIKEANEELKKMLSGFRDLRGYGREVEVLEYVTVLLDNIDGAKLSTVVRILRGEE
jgi:hypothetical protein